MNNESTEQKPAIKMEDITAQTGNVTATDESGNGIEMKTVRAGKDVMVTAGSEPENSSLDTKSRTISINAKDLHAGQNIIIVAGDFIATSEERSQVSTIPAPPRDFVGRENEINLLTKALTEGGRAAISGVTGMGGIGKSALATMVVARVSENFPDAKLWLDLHGTDIIPKSAIDVMGEVIVMLAPDKSEVLKDGNKDIVEQTYRAILYGKRVLIVLDNARDASQIHPLLTADCAFIVTSRRFFVEQGFQPLRLETMNAAEARLLLHTLCTRLDNLADTLADLCGRLPLALQIAGRFLAMHEDLTPEWYISQLKQMRLAMLKESKDFDVEAAFALTYNRLDPETQSRWRMLGVWEKANHLPHFFSAIAAGRVWDMETEKAQVVLSELRNASLIENSGKFYQFHDLLREFALARITASEQKIATEKRGRYYAEVVRNSLF